MPFNNPLAAGFTLVRKAIRSKNYVAGTTGWTINADGTFEFNGGTFRGSIIITSGQDLLIYSTPAPAANKLLLALAGSAGNDGLGNAWVAGLNIYDGNGLATGVWNTSGFKLTNDNGFGGSSGAIAANSVPGNQSPALNFVTLAGISNPSAFIASVVQGAAPSQYDNVFIEGPVTTGQLISDNVSLQMHGRIPAPLSDAAGQFVYTDNSGTAIIAGWDGTNGFVGLGGIITPAPGSLGSGITPEVWTNAALNAGFVGLSGFNPPQYQLEGMNGKRCRLAGAAQLTATKAQSSAIFTLPAAYRPAIVKYYLTANNLSGGAGQVESVHVQAGGAVEIGHSGVSGNYVFLDGIVFELD